MSTNGSWSNRLLRFEPVLQERLWGGDRLARLFGRELPAQTPVGESWELFAFAGRSVRVGRGTSAGRWLSELIRSGRVPVSEAERRSGTFPLLFKWIDANRPLSVQVHPPDDHPLLPPGHRGKTECWVVVDAEPGAELYVGLQGAGAEELREAVRCGEVERLLRREPVVPGDVIFVPSGTVHAIGAGVVLAEIQQPSDVTFRLYDWQRVDPTTGQPRTLHVEEGLACLCEHPQAGRVRPVPVHRSDGLRLESLLTERQCPVFVLQRATVSRRVRGTIPRPWSVWMVVQGQAVAAVGNRRELLRSGDTALILGDADFELEPTAAPVVLLETRLPDTGFTAWL